MTTAESHNGRRLTARGAKTRSRIVAAARGALAPEASADQLATGLLAALQGGYMLAQTGRDVTPMATSIDMALAHIESLSAG